MRGVDSAVFTGEGRAGDILVFAMSAGCPSKLIIANLPPALFDLGRDFGDGHAEAGSGQLKQCVLNELALEEAAIRCIFGVDDPNGGDAHRFVGFQLVEKLGYGVAWREDFEDGQWRVGEELLARGLPADQRNVWNSELVRGCLDADGG